MKPDPVDILGIAKVVRSPSDSANGPWFYIDARQTPPFIEVSCVVNSFTARKPSIGPYPFVICTENVKFVRCFPALEKQNIVFVTVVRDINGFGFLLICSVARFAGLSFFVFRARLFFGCLFSLFAEK